MLDEQGQVQGALGRKRNPNFTGMIGSHMEIINQERLGRGGGVGESLIENINSIFRSS